MYYLAPCIYATIYFSTVGDGKPIVKCELDSLSGHVAHLSWDTEGGNRAGTNLLRENTAVTLRAAGVDQPYTTQLQKDHLKITTGNAKPATLVFPFNPSVTPTTVLPYRWEQDGTLKLPLIINAPDFGQMLLTCDKRHLVARLEGSRRDKIVDLIIELPGPCKLEMRPVILPPPKGMKDTKLWQQVRRGFFGAMQPSARWGEQTNPFSAPPGILSNNVISDPASCSIWFYADQIFWTPNVEGISLAAQVRYSVDWWLDHRTRPTGEVVCYWDYGNFLDANAGPLIAAWDYVESTGDKEWLKKRIEKLEFIADFLAKRDIDGDGMVEATQSGNKGTLHEPNRSCAWWDALNCGYKDGYTNALIYRAWLCLSDLESKIGRNVGTDKYKALAGRLKAAYYKTLYNPKTGWLAWWKSEDGQLHDYASPTLNGLAIDYGLVEKEQAREILKRLRAKMTLVRFARFDLGLPNVLVPVPLSDYLGGGAGSPSTEDGLDSFQQYMNGGISAGHTLHYISALYKVGDREEGDRVLNAMLSRQAVGGFQNGVMDQGGKGIDWTTWDGKPCGYEGYLADSFRFLQAVLLREPAMRKRLYQPLE